MTRDPKVLLRRAFPSLGEFFYQLRAALDALIYQASSYTEGIDPPSNQERVEFPICIDPDKFKGNAVNKPPFPAELREWLLSIQPYVSTDPDNPNHLLSRYLQVLHNCARIDRHRRLHVVGVASFQLGIVFDTSPGVVVSDINWVDGNILQTEAVFARFKIEGFIQGVPQKIQLATKFNILLALEGLPIPDGSNMGQEMREMIKAVDTVIRFFKAGYGEEICD
jgi:hypothetical protein